MIGFKIKTGCKDIQRDERERFGRATCPYCNQRHFWKRNDKWQLLKNGQVSVWCRRCEKTYWIILNVDGIGTHIRAKREENDDSDNFGGIGSGLDSRSGCGNDL